MILVRVTNDWLPIPDAVLTRLGWSEGTVLDLEVVGHDTLILTKSANQEPAPKPQPVRKGQSL